MIRSSRHDLKTTSFVTWLSKTNASLLERVSQIEKCMWPQRVRPNDSKPFTAANFSFRRPALRIPLTQFKSFFSVCSLFAHSVKSSYFAWKLHQSTTVGFLLTVFLFIFCNFFQVGHRWPHVLVHIPFIVPGQKWKFFSLLESQAITGDEMKTPVRQLNSIVTLKKTFKFRQVLFCIFWV